MGDAVLSVGALGVLITVLAAMDQRMREQVMLRIHGDPSAQLSSASATLRSLTAIVVKSVHDQSIEHAPMVIFVLLAVVLLVFMLRT
jgi:hypothetical protein